MKTGSFYKKYQGKVLEDWGSVKSPDFVRFAKDMRSAIKDGCESCGMTLADFHVGHYDVSGFVEQDGRFVYFSYSLARALPIDLERRDAMRGFLYRTAEAVKDYRGGMNHFTDWANLVDDIASLLRNKSKNI